MIYEPRRVSRHRRRPRYVLYIVIVLVVAAGYWLLTGPGKPAAKPPSSQATPQQPAQSPSGSRPESLAPSQETASPKPEPVQDPVRVPTTTGPSEKPKRPAPVTPSPQPQPSPEPPQTQPRPPLELLDWRFVNDQNSRFLEGTIRDNANVNYQYVQVEVSLYDDVGSYVGTRLVNTAASGGWLPAGGTWKFRILILDARAVNCSFKLSGY